jgi:hypothetical protein
MEIGRKFSTSFDGEAVLIGKPLFILKKKNEVPGVSPLTHL